MVSKKETTQNSSTRCFYHRNGCRCRVFNFVRKITNAKRCHDENRESDMHGGSVQKGLVTCLSPLRSRARF